MENINFNNKDKPNHMVIASKEYIKNLSLQPLGIPDSGYFYHIVNDYQERSIEFKKTEEFLKWLIDKHLDEFKENTEIKFINYGDTELVYVIDESGYQRTLLVGQTNTKLGTVKIEYENLQKLYKQNSQLIICPTRYFVSKDREAYITSYFYQARCIASQEIGWGMYILEPDYYFKAYSEEDEYVVCTTMIASLITLYNEKEKLGLASCKIGGGGFILEKAWDKDMHSIKNTLNKMHLIAARKLINIELSDYISLIRREFIKKTYYNKLKEKDSSIIINVKNRISVKEETIEDGIALGLKLRKY